jgi:uncharacterized protein
MTDHIHRPSPALSAEVFIIPVENNNDIVYAPLRRAAFVTTAKVVNFLADLQVGIYDDTIDSDGSLAEFLRRLEILDAGPETQPITIFGGDPEPTMVTLFLTTACNLRCTHCYASAGDTPKKAMNLEVAKRGIDFVAANAVKKHAPFFEIGCHGGGEPTVNWSTMTASLAYAQQKAAEFGLHFILGDNPKGEKHIIGVRVDDSKVLPSIQKEIKRRFTLDVPLELNMFFDRNSNLYVDVAPVE